MLDLFCSLSYYVLSFKLKIMDSIKNKTNVILKVEAKKNFKKDASDKTNKHNKLKTTYY